MDNSSNTEQLFEASPLLEWLPDESLFSLVSRIHLLSGYRLARQTSECLFGNHRSGTHHDFPNCLGEFELRTKYSLGTAQEIALNKTLLKYYRAFIPLSDSASVAEIMYGRSVAHLKFRLGLITSRFRANHPLKTCPTCMADDRIKYGWAYWHLEHQFPGNWWCEVHNQPLYESLLKSTGVGRFLWHLPSIKELRQWPTNGIEYSNSTAQAIKSLAQTVKTLVITGVSTPWNTDNFWVIYRKELANRGWLTGQRLRFTMMVPEFLSYSRKIRILPELSALPTTTDAAKAQLGRLLRCPRNGTHPLRHIILVNWLFGGATKFLDTCKSSSSTDDHTSSENTILQITHGYNKDPREMQVLNLLQHQGISMRAAAEEVGVDINTVMAWATKIGLPINRRPKKLKEDKREELIKQLRLGVEKTDLALQTDVSIATINRILRTVPGLQREWHSTRFNLALDKARTTWSDLISRYPQLGTKLLRSMEPSIYAWLYRNDRDWLREYSPHADTPTNNRENRNMWDKRDIELSTEVKRTALDLSQKNPRVPIRLWQLYQQIPELKAKLDVLDRLPLTKHAIEQALSRSATDLNSNTGLF